MSGRADALRHAAAKVMARRAKSWRYTLDERAAMAGVIELLTAF
jgi:hypothetical protein